MALTEKQKRFCDEYLIDLNASAAYVRAGYSDKNPDVDCQKLLVKSSVRDYIKQRIKDRERRTEITQDRVLKEIADIAFDDIRNYLSFKMDQDSKQIAVEIKDSEKITTKNISEVSIGKDGQFKFKLYCKDNALNMLGKHLGIFTDKVEIGNKDGKPFQVESTSDLMAAGIAQLLASGLCKTEEEAREALLKMAQGK